MKSRTYYDNDAYVRQDIIYKSDISDVFKDDDELISSNQQVSFDVFMKDLIAHEKEFNPHSQKTMRFGVTFTILLDQLYDKEILEELCNKLSKRFKNLPYYARLRRIGHGYYVVMYVCERYYFQNKKEFNYEYTSDRYINPKTGRICKKDDPEAILSKRKGDLMGKVYYAKFSKKEELFKYASVNEFKFKIEELKLFFVELLKNIANAIIFDDLTIHKFNIKSQKDKYTRAKATYWNRAIKQIEEILAKGLNDLKLMDSHTPENINILINLRDQYAEMIKNKEFKYKRVNIYINFFQNFAYVKNNAETFVIKFLESFNKTMAKIALSN